MLKKILCFVILFFSFAFAREIDYKEENEAIKQALEQSILLYKENQFLQAKKKVEDAYFQHFENMEGSIGRNVGRKVIAMERKFNSLRKMYKDKEEISKIEALIASLKFDLDEIVPILENGLQLKAEVSDVNYDKTLAQNASLEAEKKRQQEAAKMFLTLLGEEIKDQNISTNQNLDQNLSNLQEASSLDARLQFLIDEMSSKLDQAVLAFLNKDYQKAKDFIQAALFENYRNSKVEILVARYTKAGMDKKIQTKLRSIIRQINNNTLDEKKMRDEIASILDLLYEAFLALPKEELSLLEIKGFDDQELNLKDYSKVYNDIKIALNELLQNYEGFSLNSIDSLQNIYLDIFEASGMESKIGAVDSALKLKIESYFSKGVALIKASVSKEELKQNFDELEKLIEQSLDKIQESSPISLFIWALGIILREGLEALIIIVAIMSYLIQSGNQKRLSIVYSAFWSGIFLSFVSAFLISWFFKEQAGQSRELLEGITMLIAVVLLFYVGFWLLSNAQNKKWVNFVKTQAVEAISNNSAKALWFSVFLAVFREGAETILFYQALLFDAKTNLDYSFILAGLVGGLVILSILYYLLKNGALKIPLKQFFYITSYVIFYMVFVFMGKGIGELIEAKVITPSLIPFDFDGILWLGIYPYYESIIPQFMVLILLIMGIFITKQISNKKEKI
ncbi:FTR1 family iron permease [Campylobacter volucris]|uniref:FTR1 family iron permease n=1 Tax=Campylobacter volucris TaxID=1031542 RepID=A0AAE6CZE2_9BACT|nr:ferrirhodotorulic acid ABC transporter, inner membrane protein [Campylobacter volucris LMG 24379]KAB0578987.1 FTR1 family iron permease [Campylobacter volucris]QBL13195.1 FTR1 family iron permease [Campylobacter volucris]QEL08666.1 ferrirhodotorulic acid ABC transporter, inner membrane protein [Campylobacter volucris]TXK71323.1 FTR1 family iron permease [Campylobacter volucris]